MTGKQRAYLRSLGTTMPCVLYVGQDGVTEGTVKEAEDILRAHELMKCQVRAEELTARQACERLCQALCAEPIQVIGKRFVIYRENPDKRRYADAITAL